MLSCRNTWYAASSMIPVLQEKSKHELVRAIGLAEYHVHAEEYSKALDYLEIAIRNKDPMAVTLGVVPIWRELYGDQRFKDLLAKIGLPTS